MKITVGLNAHVATVGSMSKTQALELTGVRKGRLEKYIDELFSSVNLTGRLDYPIAREVKFKIPAARRVGEILYYAAKEYKKIYKRPHKYGVWGHDITDLVFEGLRIDTETRTVSFYIGS